MLFVLYMLLYNKLHVLLSTRVIFWCRHFLWQPRNAGIIWLWSVLECGSVYLCIWLYSFQSLTATELVVSYRKNFRQPRLVVSSRLKLYRAVLIVEVLIDYCWTKTMRSLEEVQATLQIAKLEEESLHNTVHCLSFGDNVSSGDYCLMELDDALVKHIEAGDRYL